MRTRVIQTRGGTVVGLRNLAFGFILGFSGAAYSQDAAEHSLKPILSASPEAFLSAEEIKVIQSNQKISGYLIAPSKEVKKDTRSDSPNVSFINIPQEERDKLSKILIDPRNYDFEQAIAGDNTVCILTILDGVHTMRLDCGQRFLLISGANDHTGFHFCYLNETGAAQLHSWIESTTGKYGKQEEWFFKKQVSGDFMTPHERELLGGNL